MSEVFSRKVIGGRRTYFFDVKETKDQSKYIVIGEVAQVGDELERHRVMVFEENVGAFCEGLQAAIEYVGIPVDIAGGLAGLVELKRMMLTTSGRLWTESNASSRRSANTSGEAALACNELGRDTQH